MSSERIELVLRAEEAVRQGDAEALIGMCTEDVVLLPGRSALLGGYHGPAGVRKFFADNAETYELFSVASDERHETDEHVVAIGRVTARLRDGGLEASAPAAFVFSFEDGKIARAEDHRDRSAALAAAGIDV